MKIEIWLLIQRGLCQYYSRALSTISERVKCQETWAIFAQISQAGIIIA